MHDISIHHLKKTKSRRAASYRRLIEGYLGNKINPDYEKISKNVEKEIRKITKFELKLTSRWWLLFIRLIDSEKGSSEINKYIDDLFNETLSLPFTKNSSFALLNLYALLLEYGLYSIGCIIRSQITKLVLEEGFNNKSSQNIIERYLSAAFEEGKYSELQDSLEKLIAINRDNEEILLLDLLLHKIIIKKSNKKIIKDQYIDRNYLEIIKGQRVAIVGPSQNNLDNGKEIDSFDIIVRFNYKGENISAKNYGSRTDISYFNEANTRDLEKKHKGLDIGDLKAAVYKVPVIENYLSCKCNRRMSLPIEHFMIDSAPFAFPSVVADLLLYQPSELKVFNIDMHITCKRDSSYGAMRKSFWKEFYPKAEQDPYSNYLFIEYLYSNNFINVESKLKKILDLGIMDYMKELQEVYLDKALCR